MALDLPRVPPPIDPYVDLHALEPLFVADDTGHVMSIGKSRLNLFRPASFAKTKDPKTFRIFALGGSTTQGEPYSTESSFPKWLELGLQTAVPDRRVEVINCGGLSYASYRVLAILREILQYEPDLVVVYTGHNEFLEKRTYADVHQSDSLWSRSLRSVARLHMVQLVDSMAGFRAERATPPRAVMSKEVDALLDYSGGLEQYRRSEMEAWRPGVVVHFGWNLQQMINACRQTKTPLVLMRPVSNLLDCPPMKFELDQNLSAERLAEFEVHWQAAQTARRAGNSEQAMLEVNEALHIDNKHAGALFLGGRMLFEQGDFPRAKEMLTRARDCDVCPLRAPTEILDKITEIASHFSVPIFDCEAFFSRQSEPPFLVSDRQLIDHIHPHIEGHQALGRELANLVIEAGWILPSQPNWQNGLTRVYDEYLLQLSEAYFQRGQQRLIGLRLWTQGRAKKVAEENSLIP
ncbi:MAG: hypothetical protein KDB03_01315 [Planctomycetales bacterium]|nr:hypothetical protein [Planctomycetales bacterium]